MIIVVLGMHKSGTTLVSEMLHKSGINMVEEFDDHRDYYAGNKVERVATLELNHQILNSKSIFSLDIPSKPLYQCTEEQWDLMYEIINGCQKHYDWWGFKDPRTCITYPLWSKVLPPHKLIIVYRPPVDVINHYVNRVSVLNKFSRATKCYDQWVQHNSNILKYIQHRTDPTLIINYQDLLDRDKLLNDLSNFVEKDLKDIRLKKGSCVPKSSELFFSLLDRIKKRKASLIFSNLESHKIG